MSAARQESSLARAPFLGVVFAGGGSRRMGGDKAVLPWPTNGAKGGEVPLFVRAGEVLEELCERVEISIGHGASRPVIEGERWSTFADELVDAGPLAGLTAALKRATSLGLKGVLALACDMPLVLPEDFSPLLSRLDSGADAAIWTVRDPRGVHRDQPLVGAYALSCAASASAALAGVERRMVSIEAQPMPGGRPLRLDRVAATEKSAHRLVNVNTPSDYDSAHAAAMASTPESAPPQ